MRNDWFGDIVNDRADSIVSLERIIFSGIAVGVVVSFSVAIGVSGFNLEVVGEVFGESGKDNFVISGWIVRADFNRT